MSQQQQLTCITCRSIFKTDTEMREHYKTEWHRFNLKRKVTGLPPVQFELYQQKLADVQNNNGKEVKKGTQHLKKDKAQAQQQPTPAAATTPSTSSAPQPQTIKTTTTTTTTAPEPVSVAQPNETNVPEEELIDQKITKAVRFTPQDSLFDRHQSASFEQNLLYMTNTFGFFIPEVEYLLDIKGLIEYLGEKVSIGNTCIWCQKTFYTTEGVQSHMRDLGHCKILWEDNEQEYNQYYDLDTADKRFAVWMDDEDSNEDQDQGESKSKSKQEKDQSNQNDDEPAKIYTNENNELVVGNRSIGHRALQVYYKQRPHNPQNRQLITSLLQEHKRLQQIQHQARTTHDTNYIQKNNTNNLKVGIAGNKQKHYRNQNPM